MVLLLLIIIIITQGTASFYGRKLKVFVYLHKKKLFATSIA